MSSTVEQIINLKANRTESRQEARKFREAARKMADKVRADSHEIDQLENQAVRELLAEGDLSIRHASFNLRRKRCLYTTISSSQSEAWDVASDEFHKALRNLIRAKIQLLRHFAENPEQLERDSVQVTVNAQKAENPSTRPWLGWYNV